MDAAFEVHRILGPGYLESVYEQALAEELVMRRVAFEPEVPIALEYKGVPVGRGRLDVLVEDRLTNCRVEGGPGISTHPSDAVAVVPESNAAQAWDTSMCHGCVRAFVG